MGTVTRACSCDEHIQCRINNPGPDIVLISTFQPDIVALISAFSGDLSKECISKSNPLRSSVRDSKSEPKQTPQFSARITKVESKNKIAFEYWNASLQFVLRYDSLDLQRLRASYATSSRYRGHFFNDNTITITIPSDFGNNLQALIHTLPSWSSIP